jgi:ribosomal protein S18 acetylase RimI-like enzyme
MTTEACGNMEIAVLPVNNESLVEYSKIPNRFEVSSRLSVGLINGGIGGAILYEEGVVPPYIKDYDALEVASEGEGPTRWPRVFDTSNWGLFLIRQDGVPIGGATVAFRTTEVQMLGGRDDITVLWDIRVHPEHRRSGIGSALFNEAASWSRERGCQYLKIETQNINVPACRFYHRQGCRLGEINRFAYIDYPDEVMLVWYLTL